MSGEQIGDTNNNSETSVTFPPQEETKVNPEEKVDMKFPPQEEAAVVAGAHRGQGKEHEPQAGSLPIQGGHSTMNGDVKVSTNHVQMSIVNNGLASLQQQKQQGNDGGGTKESQSLPVNNEHNTDSPNTSTSGLVSVSSSSTTSLSSQGSITAKTDKCNINESNGGANQEVTSNSNVQIPSTSPQPIVKMEASKSQSSSFDNNEENKSTLVSSVRPIAPAPTAPIVTASPQPRPQPTRTQVDHALRPVEPQSVNPLTAVKPQIITTGSSLIPPGTVAATHGFRVDSTLSSTTLVANSETSNLRPNNTVPIAAKATSNHEIQRMSTNSATTHINPASSNHNATAQSIPQAQQVTRQRSNSVPNYLTPEFSTKASASKSGRLRRGKWTVEEEAYVAHVIQDFNSGYLDAPAGTTLRTFLSDKLNCDPMRITKKFTGDSCIGKRVFHPAVRCANNTAAIDKAQSELDALERRWRRRLEMQQRESAKKQAASAAAAAAAAASGRLHVGHGANLQQNLATHRNGLGNPNDSLAQTASWLDRANAILSNTQGVNGRPVSKANSREDAVAKEMEEVQRLIHEGPIIQKTSAGLTTLLERNSDTVSTTNTNTNTNTTSSTNPVPSSKRKVSDDQVGKTQTQFSTPLSTTTVQQPLKQQQQQITSINAASSTTTSTHNQIRCNGGAAEKRIRRSVSANHLAEASTDAAEDAATLMGFLSSVRQQAAAQNNS